MCTDAKTHGRALTCVQAPCRLAVSELLFSINLSKVGDARHFDEHWPSRNYDVQKLKTCIYACMLNAENKGGGISQCVRYQGTQARAHEKLISACKFHQSTVFIANIISLFRILPRTIDSSHP